MRRNSLCQSINTVACMGMYAVHSGCRMRYTAVVVCGTQRLPYGDPVSRWRRLRAYTDTETSMWVEQHEVVYVGGSSYGRRWRFIKVCGCWLFMWPLAYIPVVNRLWYFVFCLHGNSGCGLVASRWPRFKFRTTVSKGDPAVSDWAKTQVGLKTCNMSAQALPSVGFLWL